MPRSSAIFDAAITGPTGYEKIIDRRSHEDFFTDGFSPDIANTIITFSLNEAPARQTPTILHMLGIPGAGKSTYVSTLNHAEKTLVSFDKITEVIPGYQNDRQKIGAAGSFAKWELPARMLGYHILHQAVRNRQDIIFDHGGSRQDHVMFLNAIKRELGYSIEIVYMQTNQNVSIERVNAREQTGGRHVPESYIPERQLLIEQLLPQYQAIADRFTTITV